MNSLWKFSFGKLSLLILISSEVFKGISAYDGHRTTKKPEVNWNGQKPRKEQIILDRFRRALPKAEQIRSKTQAAQILQSNLIPVLQALSRSDKRIPPNVKLSAGAVVRAIQDGKLLQPLANSLPTIMINNPKKSGSVANQLAKIMTALISNAPPGYRPSLQSLAQFLRSNVNAVKNLLSGVPDLLQVQGVVAALLRPLGAVT